MGTKMIKNRPLYIFFPKLSAYKIDFDGTECIYFMIKEEIRTMVSCFNKEEQSNVEIDDDCVICSLLIINCNTKLVLSLGYQCLILFFEESLIC